MRKRIMLAAAAASLVMLTGCLAKTYPLTEEEQNIIAEYAAGVLLRNDENYTQALISPTPLPTMEPTPSPTLAPTAVPDKNGNSHTGKGDGSANTVTENASLDEVYGLEGLSVQYDGYELCSAIQESDGYVVRAGKGNVLVQVNFILTNDAGIDQVFTFSKQDIKYQLDYGAKKYAQPKVTGLILDMLYAEIFLPAGESCERSVFFEVPEDGTKFEGRVIVSRGDDYTSIVTLE